MFHNHYPPAKKMLNLASFMLPQLFGDIDYRN
jgi:hypothetical protein